MTGPDIAERTASAAGTILSDPAPPSPSASSPVQPNPAPSNFIPSNPVRPARTTAGSHPTDRSDTDRSDTDRSDTDRSDRTAQLTVVPWWDPQLAETGVDPRDPYVERFWLGILGPSTVLLLRRFARGLEEHPSGFRVRIVDTSLALGLGRGMGRNAPITRTINRAVGFGLLRPTATDRIEARTHIPLLKPRQVRQLPPVLRQVHAEWVAARAPATPTR